MKAFLSRINRGLSKEKDRDKEPVHKEKIPSLPPLREWPPQLQQTTPNSMYSYKPLPEISTRPLPPITDEFTSSSADSSANPTPAGSVVPLPSSEKENAPVHDQPASPTAARVIDADSAGRNSHKTNNTSGGSNAAQADIQKKVAFISPPPTPGLNLQQSLPAAETPTPASTAGAPLKTTVSRFQASQQPKDPRGSTSTAASSRTDVAGTAKSAKPASTRATTSPYPRAYGDAASIHQSLRSGTPYSQLTNASSRILSVQSWSEGAEEDLVSNIGQRERTRQEVLWEIVASEDRYVTELQKMRDTFIDPLLHPYSTPSPTTPAYDEFVESPRESIDYLPIASRFLSPTPFRSDSPSDDQHKDVYHTNDGESLNSEEEEEAEDRLGKSYTSRKVLSPAAKHNHPRSPYGKTPGRPPFGGKLGTTLPFPSRSHQSLPPPPRVNPNGSTQSLGRQSTQEHDTHNGLHSPRLASTPAPSNRLLRKPKKSDARPPPVAITGAVPPAQLPEDLKKCLEVIEESIIKGHETLSEGLKKRYDEQYPLVRSLADVFVANSHILHGYATFVLHLERALEQVDNALSTVNAAKKPKKQDADQWLKVSQYIQKLEIMASEKGETGLAISLSKPFQRLLKYPLLFQNLLFHTDPSTYEYESTLQMVAEVETIVRSIEDEKIQKEERDKTRDVFARIEGLDKVKQLMVPKPSRQLLEERPVLGVNPITEKSGFPPTAAQNVKVKGKTSFKRLSDVLQVTSSGVGGKRDQWLVVFNDVVLRCQRTGTTSLPLSTTTNARATSLPELQGKAKYATTGRRNSQGKPRNLYKFLKIETWDIGEVVQPREGVISMEDVVRSRQQAHSSMTQQQPRIVPLPDDDEDVGGDSDDSDRKSKMSFSYWGADKVTLQKPVVVKPRQGSGNGARRGAVTPTSYGRESSANAKFGTRLVTSPDNPMSGVRPASRRTQATPTGRRPAASEDNHSVRATVTRSERPEWNTSTRATATPIPRKERVRNMSQTSTATRTPTQSTTALSTTNKLSSPAPSEDSGVGFYRTIIAQNPSLGRLPS
ncbi:Dbl domain-containing protein [Irpex rosettiformis]|uniref:Dbl domain-containing protein n=1 Tax=Irpex rosettiformis TaxID=378272 RepID=A0ACB8UI61_9APHY|nr:Dbl domain-containing protein [Irpex rosettiformis]